VGCVAQPGWGGSGEEGSAAKEGPPSEKVPRQEVFAHLFRDERYTGQGEFGVAGGEECNNRGGRSFEIEKASGQRASAAPSEKATNKHGR